MKSQNQSGMPGRVLDIDVNSPTDLLPTMAIFLCLCCGGILFDEDSVIRAGRILLAPRTSYDYTAARKCVCRV